MDRQDTHTELASDLRINRVITGLWQIADMERDDRLLDREQTACAMQAYSSAGLTTFDMADHYGSAEEIAGLFAREYAGGDSVQMLTKWVPQPGGSTRETVREAVQRALDRLQTNKLDLLQYHAWNYADPSYLDDLAYLQELRDKGLIQHLGLTNFDTAHLRVVLASGVRVVSNQICYSLLDQRARGDMARLCAAENVKILAFGTLAGGFLTDRWLDKLEPAMASLTTWSHMKYKRYIDEAGGWTAFQQLLQTLRKIADQHNVSIANIASRYILEQPTVGGVIIGARLGENEHIRDNLKLLGFEIGEDSSTALQPAIDKMVTIPGDCGDEYRKPPYLTASGDLSHHFDNLPPPYPTQSGTDGRTQALSGTQWEEIAGFSRAVRIDNRILVSGTTATHGDRVIGAGDPQAQTDFIIDKIEGTLQSLGGSLDNVVRTRIYIRNIKDWEAVSKVHGRRFGHIKPANTLVRADLVGEDYLVEMEAEAVQRSDK